MGDSSENNSSLSDVDEVTPLPSLSQQLKPKLLEGHHDLRSVSQSPPRSDNKSGQSSVWNDFNSSGYKNHNNQKFKKLDLDSPTNFLSNNNEIEFRRYGSTRNIQKGTLNAYYDEEGNSQGLFNRKNNRALTQTNQLMAPRRNYKSMGMISYGKQNKEMHTINESKSESRMNSNESQGFKTDNGAPGTPSSRLINAIVDNQVFSPQSDNSVIEEPPTMTGKRKQFWNFKKRGTETQSPDKINRAGTRSHQLGFFATHLITKAMNRFKRLRATDLKPKQLELLDDFTYIKTHEKDGDVNVMKSYTIRNITAEDSFWNSFMLTKLGKFFQKKFPKKCKKRSQLLIRQKKIPLKLKLKLFWRQIKQPIAPTDRFRLLWDMTLMLLLLIDMVLLPLQLSFSIWDDNKQFEFGNDAVFFADIILNFHTAYFYKGDLINDHKMIAQHYLRGWFFIDVLSSFPYGLIDYFYEGDDDNGISSSRLFRLFRLLRLLKVLRALRFFKLHRIFKKFRGIAEFSQSAHGPIQLIKLLVVVLLLAHWLACAWHLTATFDDTFADEQTWLNVQHLVYADAYVKYTRSLYWSVTTMLTVGYGDIVPVSIPETWFAVFAILFGCGVFAYTLNTIGLIVRQISEKGSETRNKIDAIHGFMQRKNLSKDIQNKLKSYIEYLMEEESTQKQEQDLFLSFIPEHMRKEVLIDINSRVLTQNFIFNINFAKSFLCNLSFKLHEKTLGPGEIIFTESDSDDSVYFITRGRIEIYLEKNGKVLNVLSPGNHFGEIKFLSGRARTASARSLNFAHVFCLERKALLAALEKHPDEKESYCHIKDKINLYSDYRVLKVKCYACDREGHVTTECPDLHFQPDPYAIMKRINIMEKTFRNNFLRKTRRKFNALYNNSEIKRAAKEYCVDLVNASPKGSWQRSISLAKNHKNFVNVSLLSAEQDSSILSGISEPTKRKPRKMPLNDKAGSLMQLKDPIPNIKDMREPLLRYSPKSNGFRIVNMSAEPNQHLPVILSKPTRKQEKNDEIEFDKVKTFTKYFPHNNIVNVVKKMKKFFEDKENKEFEAISRPRRRFSVDDLKIDHKQDTSQTKEKSSKTETLNALIMLQKKEQARARSVEFLALNSEKTEKLVTESSFSQNNSFHSINSPRNTSGGNNNSRASRILESKIWKISLIGPEEEQQKRESILFEQK